MKLGVVIPALDEEACVGQVVRRCRGESRGLGEVRIIVCDNGSADDTAQVAADAGAEVVFVPRKGYGAACLAGIAHLGGWPDILAFLDADGSSRPEELAQLVEPLTRAESDLVLGVRSRTAEMTPSQRWGTRLAVVLVNLIWRTRYHDMGPFRCLTAASYGILGMRDRTWGWTIEMQILAAEKGLRFVEIPVSWDSRLAGSSKISGTVSGVARAGAKILWTVTQYAWMRYFGTGR